MAANNTNPKQTRQGADGRKDEAKGLKAGRSLGGGKSGGAKTKGGRNSQGGQYGKKSGGNDAHNKR